METANEVVSYPLLLAGIKKLVYSSFIAIGCVGVELVPGGSETGPPHEVGDQFNVVVSHLSPPK